jgi:D-alanine-D-alanine ligase
MAVERIFVLVLYNHLGEDEYEKLKQVDESQLDFEPEYPIQVATVREEYAALVRALRQEGFMAGALNLEDDISKLEALIRRRPPDVIFNLVEHFRDQPALEANVAGLLELHDIPYTGAPPFSLTLCQRKGLTKQLLLANGVPTPRYRLLHTPEMPRQHGLRYPLIVKPAREDASSGVEKSSVVHNLEQLEARLKAVFEEYPPPVLVEEFIEGRELHVSILGNHPPEVLPIIEWDFSELPPDHPPIISYDVKWDPLAEVYHRVHSFCPAKLSRAALRKVREVAIKAYRVTGCRDYARLDIRLAQRAVPYVLDVNPNPDLTEGVSFMESAEAAGYSFSQTLRRIVELALERREPGA